MKENTRDTIPRTNNIPPLKQRLSTLSYKEGKYTVKTELTHLKRGWCCDNRCRHCPYQDFEVLLVDGGIYRKLRPLVKRAIVDKAKQDPEFLNEFPLSIQKVLL